MTVGGEMDTSFCCAVLRNSPQSLMSLWDTRRHMKSDFSEQNSLRSQNNLIISERNLSAYSALSAVK